MLVRTWNLFHGNTKPPGRAAYLERMVGLIAEDGADVVCLQEVPAWALPRLGEWSGMQAMGDVARRVRVPRELGRRLTALHPGLFRGTFNGQANAVLVNPGHRIAARQLLVLNPPPFRRAKARQLGLGAVARAAWARERRVCQAVRVRASGRTILVGNLHATAYALDRRLADAELLRAATFVDALAGPAEATVLAGDFNVRLRDSPTLRALCGDEWGFSPASSWLDHVLVRGVPSSPPQTWPDERRRHAGRLLSDHAPVEVRLDV